MNTVKQIFLSLSLVFMAATAPLSAMEQGKSQKQVKTQKEWLIATGLVSEKDITTALVKATEKQYGEWLEAQKPNQKNTRKKFANINKETKRVITEILMYEQAPSAILVDDAVVVDSAVADNAPVSMDNNEDKVSNAEDHTAPCSGAIVLYQDPSANKPVTYDVSFALKLIEEKQLPSLPASQPDSLFLKIASQYQNPSLKVIKFGQAMVEAVGADLEVDNLVLGLNLLENPRGPVVGILKNENGNMIAEVTEDNDVEVPVENPVVNNPPVIEVPVELNNPIDQEVPVNPEAPVERNNPINPENNAFGVFNTKQLVFGLVGVCGVGVLGWKLYKNSSYYQCSLLKSWQTKVATAVENVGTKDSNVPLPEIELSQLTRLNDVEREQLIQAHNALLAAFAKAQDTVAATYATPGVEQNKGHVDINQTPVINELKATHAQWDGLMNDCKSSVENGAMRFW